MSNLAMTASLPHGRSELRSRYLLLLASLVFANGPAVAASFVVNSVIDARDSNAGDGVCSTGSGVCSLRAAIEETNALPGADTIALPSSIYLITLGDGDDKAERGDFDVTDVVTIIGSGQFSTIVDGNSVDRVFDVLDDGSLNLSDITIRNGDEAQGAGIRNANDLFLTDVTFSNNVGKNGGGVYVHKNGSTATVTNVTFANNSANKGGGLYAKDNASVSIVDSTFSSNFTSSSDVETKDGGGAYFDKTIASITRSVFEDNRAKKGGGLFAKGNAIVSIVESTFLSNSVTKDGGGLYFDKISSTIAGSLFDGNSAEKGGGLFVKGGGTDVAITNVTVSNNSSGEEGGGIQKEGNGIARLTSVTVYANSSPLGGGLRGKDGTLSLLNTIVANNSQGLNCDGTITSLGNNLASDSSCQLGQVSDLPSTDPLVGPLQNNGGPTLTHALLETSPARDTGTNAGCPAIDQRGVSRPIDGNGDGIAVCDIGAYEAESLYPDYSLQKTVTTVSDPYSGTTNPKAIPGAIMQYTISFSNDGPGAADQDSIIITEALPPYTSLMVIDFDAANPGPVAFVDGATASGLSYSFVALDSTLDDIEFSNDDGVNYDYSPSPDADGSDPSVTHFRITPTGTAEFTGANPVAEFLLKVLVR